MHIHSKFHVSIIFTVVVIFSMPIVASAQVLPYAQDPALAQAALDARQDAETLFDERLWYFAGCFFSFGGYFVAKTYYSPVPAIALLGHPPNYVAVYTDHYRARMRELRSHAALNGCIHGAILQACLPVTAALFTRR